MARDEYTHLATPDGMSREEFERRLYPWKPAARTVNHDRQGFYQRPGCQWSRRENWPRRAAVYLRDNFTCQTCGYRPPDEVIPPAYDGQGTIGDLVIDHIIPLHQGGSRWDPANLQVLCKACNGSKG